MIRLLSMPFRSGRLLWLLAFSWSATMASEPSPQSLAKSGAGRFNPDAVTYPAGSIKTLAEMGLTVAQFTARAAGRADYAGNTGRDSLSIIASPYFHVCINGADIPVYGTLAYLGASNQGAIHSYTTIQVRDADFPLRVKIGSNSLALTNAIVLPATLGITPTLAGGTFSATLTKTGAYTFLFNNASQECALTLFVRSHLDEAAEIAEYRRLYGTNGVIVFEPGVHVLDYLNVTNNNTIVYLRAGSLLVANHTLDIDNDADRASKADPQALAASNGAIHRFPFLSARGRQNVKVLGRGTIDFTRLDWHERNGMAFDYCTDIEIRGITLVNPAEWAVTSYRVANLKIGEVTIFGHRTNSDGINVCNSRNAVVSDCFARTGDDLFSVKTLGGDSTAVCENVTFQNCVGWAGKARCYGITGEVERDVRNITFRDCAVIYRDATWDNNRLGSLVVIVENGGAAISNVTFENIEIFRDLGRAINCNVYESTLTGCTMQGIRFRNITCHSVLQGKLAAANRTNSLSVSFSGVKVNGVALNAGNVTTHFEKDAYASYTFE